MWVKYANENTFPRYKDKETEEKYTIWNNKAERWMGKEFIEGEFWMHTTE